MTSDSVIPIKIRATKAKKKAEERIQTERQREEQFEQAFQSSASSLYTDEITHISISGAREHNLKGVSVSIPRDKLVVITGLSGSGKSSLAFDTLYAEGQRRYVECLSPYARQFLGMMKKPDVDVVEGISPAISIEQKSVSQSPRSTVGTVTEVYDYLRLLYAKIGVQYCVNCNIPVQSQSIDQIVDTILGYGTGARIQVLAPLVRGRKGHYRELFETLQKQGYTRVRVDGDVVEITAGMMVDRYKVHNIELVVDRIILDTEQRSRVAQSAELALKIGEDRMIALREVGEQWVEQLFSTSYSCPNCNESYEPLAPNMFSFNSPFGACQNCQGLGEMRDFDMQLVVPDPTISLARGAISLLGKERETWLWEQIRAMCKQEDIDMNAPFSSLSKEHVNLIYYGGKKVKVNVEIRSDLGVNYNVNAKFPGVLNTFRQQYESTSSSKIRDWLETFMGEVKCPECNGGRLKQQSLFVRVHGRSIEEATNVDIPEAVAAFQKLRTELSEREYKIANLIVKEIVSRLSFLENVGLSYLSLNRSARTLSGGESQRIRLASQIGSQLVGVMYVLDEPSIGLHQHDNSKLISSLKQLRDLGNTIIVVEHDREMIEEADVNQIIGFFNHFTIMVVEHDREMIEEA
ncbi:MAG: hypothetical protein JNL32_14485, partial [Candidatus Kapabacteria bacterium]|nr:hypothetical protein [Candidatus Kapabacteria bacterium]